MDWEDFRKRSCALLDSDPALVKLGGKIIGRTGPPIALVTDEDYTHFHAEVLQRIINAHRVAVKVRVLDLVSFPYFLLSAVVCILSFPRTVCCVQVEIEQG